MADFDWTKIAGPLLSAGSTVVGTVIGGPGGAAIGKAAGEVLAGALGVPATPDDVAEAIQANPDAAKAVMDSPEAAEAIAKAQAEIIKTVNETYRVELQQESWVIRLWRPICGWCLAIIWTVHGFAIGLALWTRNFDVIKTIPDLTVFYGVMGAVVGVYAWGRTAEKKAGVATGAPEAIAETIGAVVKKITKK